MKEGRPRWVQTGARWGLSSKRRGRNNGRVDARGPVLCHAPIAGSHLGHAAYAM